MIPGGLDRVGTGPLLDVRPSQLGPFGAAEQDSAEERVDAAPFAFTRSPREPDSCGPARRGG